MAPRPPSPSVCVSCSPSIYPPQRPPNSCRCAAAGPETTDFTDRLPVCFTLYRETNRVIQGDTDRARQARAITSAAPPAATPDYWSSAHSHTRFPTAIEPADILCRILPRLLHGSLDIEVLTGPLVEWSGLPAAGLAAAVVAAVPLVMLATTTAVRWRSD